MIWLTDSPPGKDLVTLGHHLISLGKRKISDTFEPPGTTWINLSTKPSPWTVAVDRGSPKKFVTSGRSQGAPRQWLAEAGHALETPASLKPHKKLDATSPPKKKEHQHQTPGIRMASWRYFHQHETPDLKQKKHVIPIHQVPSPKAIQDSSCYDWELAWGTKRSPTRGSGRCWDDSFG